MLGLLPSQAELDRAANEARERLIKQKEDEQRAFLKTSKLFNAVDATLRFPFLAGVSALETIAQLPRRLYEDITELPEGFQRVILAPNKHKDELGGHILVFDEKTQGLKAPAILSSKHAFGVTALFLLVPDVGGTLSSFRSQYTEALKASVSRFGQDAPAFEAYLPSSAEDAHDQQRWSAFLPPRSRVGLYRRDRSIFLIIKTHAGAQIASTVNALLAEEQATLGSFATDRRFKRIKSMVVRNVQRVAARIARDLNLPVKTYDDVFTRLSDDLSYYELAAPTMIIRHNHIRLDTRSRSVNVYIDVACRSAVVYARDEYAKWCGRTLDYVTSPRPNDDDATILPLKTDKLAEGERIAASEEEQERIAHSVHYTQPRSQNTGRFIKYHGHHDGDDRYRHISSIYV